MRRFSPPGPGFAAPVGHHNYLPSPQKVFLIVEDNKINRMIMSKYMKKLNQPCEAAEDGQIAVEMFTKDPQRYAGIFMDQQMPVMGGIEATRHIRQFEQKHRLIPITIIALVVHSMGITEAMESGADSYLPKPLRFSSMKDIIIHIRQLQLAQATMLRRRFGARL